MREPTYRQALKASWHLAWNNKILWVFGLFAAFWGQIGLMDLLSKLSLSTSYLGFSPVWWMTPRVWFDTNIFSSLNLGVNGWVWLVWLSIIVLGFLIMLIFVSTVSQGTIIKVASQMIKSDKLPNIDKAWHTGSKNFWRLLFLNVIKKMILVFLGFFLGSLAILLAQINSGLDVFLFVILFLVLASVGVIVSFLAVYAAGYIVVENYKLFEAIKKAWDLFKNHWLVSVEVGLIIMVLNLALTVIAIAGLFLLFFPSLLFWLGSVLLYNPFLILIGTLLGLVLFMLFIFMIVAVFSVFNISVWTYLFCKMHHEGIKSRIIHYFNR